MKKILCLSACAAAAALLAAGCGHLSMAGQGGFDRTLQGYVDFTPPGGENSSLPDDAQMVVRVIDENPAPAPDPIAAAGIQPLYNGQSSGVTHSAPVASQVLGEVTIPHVAQTAVQNAGWRIPFTVPYQAGDDELRHGVNIEVNISYGGRVRYSNLNQYAVTLSDVDDPHTVRVEQAR